jgi:hypothetical protein
MRLTMKQGCRWWVPTGMSVSAHGMVVVVEVILVVGLYVANDVMQ